MKIFKYALRVTDIQIVQLPKDAQILTVQIQQGNVCIWAMVNPDNQLMDRRIEIIGTGNPIPSGTRSYIGTVQQHGGALIWHVFERLG